MKLKIGWKKTLIGLGMCTMIVLLSIKDVESFPSIDFEKEYAEIITENDVITYEGRIENCNCVTIEGIPVQIDKDLSFKYDYCLNEGLNVVRIIASDYYDNSKEYISTIYYQPHEETDIPWIKIAVIICAIFLIIIYFRDIYIKSKIGNEKKYLFKELITFVMPVVVIFSFFNFIVTIGVVQSSSMEPTLNVGDTCFYNQMAYKEVSDIQRGDIIDFDSEELGKHISKRVVGLPGDKIEFKDGKVVINGQYIDETNYCISEQDTNSSKIFIVPDESFFVLGDNRGNSLDSRYWVNPYVSFDNINGKYMGKVDFSIQYDIFGGYR